MQRGHLIVLEGMDGCGKGTQLRKLEMHLEEKGIDCKIVNELLDTELGKELGIKLKDPTSNLSAEEQQSLFFKLRMELVKKVIEPYLNEGKTALADRYYHSTYAYQVCAQGANINEYKLLSSRPYKTRLSINIRY